MVRIIIVSVVAGMLLMQHTTLAVYLFLGKKDYKTTTLYAISLFYCIYKVCLKIKNFVQLSCDKKRYNLYWFYENNYPIFHAFMTSEMAKRFETNKNKPYYIELVRPGFEFQIPVDRNYIITPDSKPKDLEEKMINKFLLMAIDSKEQC